MNLDELLDELEPVSPEELDHRDDGQFDTLHTSLAEMLRLAERTAKAGYRAGQSTEHVGEQVTALREFVESEVRAKEEDLREVRSKVGELTDERDRLIRALMEAADLTASASGAARNELDEKVAGRFERLHAHVEKVLKRAGLEPMATHGESFNPEYHEAIDQVPSNNLDPRSILEVVRQGYRYRGEVVRIARVILTE